MSWPSCLALLRFSKVSEPTEVTAQRLLRNKLVSGSVRAISNREERDMRDGSAVSRIRWHRIRWALQAESGGCAVVSPLRMLRAQGHVTVAKLIVGLKSLLSLVWHLQIHSWPGSTGIHGATEAASPQNSKLSPM